MCSCVPCDEGMLIIITRDPWYDLGTISVLMPVLITNDQIWDLWWFWASAGTGTEQMQSGFQDGKQWIYRHFITDFATCQVHCLTFPASANTSSKWYYRSNGGWQQPSLSHNSVTSVYLYRLGYNFSSALRISFQCSLSDEWYTENAPFKLCFGLGVGFWGWVFGFCCLGLCIFERVIFQNVTESVWICYMSLKRGKQGKAQGKGSFLTD